MLFKSFLHIAEANSASCELLTVNAGGRDALLLLSPNEVRSMLIANNDKGRSRNSRKRIGGYIALEGDRFRTSKADVVVALRKISLQPDRLAELITGLQGSQVNFGPTLVASLAGIAIEHDLLKISESALVELRRQAENTDNRANSKSEQASANRLASKLNTDSAFVSELLSRGWNRIAIAREILVLSFAGWASLCAAYKSGIALNVTGNGATEDSVTEILRYAPPGWLIVRETNERTNFMLRGNIVPSGTLMIASPWLLHRSTASWTQPQQFCPGRVTNANGSFAPFSFGMHSCPAAQYSRMFLQVALQAASPVASPSKFTVSPMLVDGRSAAVVRTGSQSQ